jgi:CSLREA domain-containing protein
MPVVLVLAVLAGLLLTSPARADTFAPTRFDDPKPARKCKPTDCSLREAIRTANNQNGRDTVALAHGTYKLEIPPADNGINESGELFSVGDLRLRGLGPNETKIDAQGIDRVLAVGGKARIQNLTLKGGDASANPFHDSRGGAILTLGDKLTVKNVVFKDNAAEFGGAINSAGIDTTIEKSTITHNSASEGGGIYVASHIGPASVVNLRNSTVSHNNAGKGAGILADGAPGLGSTVPIFLGFNSTVANNESGGDGGGVMSDNGASVIFSNSTIAYNTADVNNSGGGAGGGVRQSGGAFLNLYDSIVASNAVGTSGTDSGCSGTFAGDGNVLTALAGCASFSASTNQFVGSALIGPLADNGGPTNTIKLLALSPALGYALDCPKTDQRGEKRPDDDCDSGAYERKGP